MAESAFERYLFRKCSAVYINGLSQFATNVHLLDVLIKKNTEGLFPARPVVKRAGSMVDLGTVSSEEVQNRLRQVLSCFEQDLGDELLEKHHPPDIKLGIASAKSLSGSLLAQPWAEVEAHLSDVKNLTLRLRGLETACVNKDKIVEFVTQGQWKPKSDDERLDWPEQPNCLPMIFGRDGRQLWVIHQILYASELVVTSGASASTGANVTVVPGAPGAGVSTSRESGPNFLRVTVGTNSNFPAGKFMFAFRAICFRFNAEGELVGKVEDVDPDSTTLPVHRGEDDDMPYDDDRAQICDLFLEEPPEVGSDSDGEEDDQEWDARILPIE